MPSQKILEQKKEMVAELAEKIKKASSGVLVDFKGINVADDTALRSELRKADVEYAVIKNTTIRLAAEQAGYDKLNEVLEGTTALAISMNDAVAPARILADFAEKGKLAIKAGFVDGGVIGVDQVNELSKIPSKEVLIAKMLGSMMSPLSGLAIAFSARGRLPPSKS